MFSFASILLGLISKHLVLDDIICESIWPKMDYNNRLKDSNGILPSLVDNSFERQSGFDACSAAIITKMATVCQQHEVRYVSIKEVLKVLEACYSILEVKLNQKPYIGFDMTWEASQWYYTMSIFPYKLSVNLNTSWLFLVILTDSFLNLKFSIVGTWKHFLRKI